MVYNYVIKRRKNSIKRLIKKILSQLASVILREETNYVYIRIMIIDFFWIIQEQ